MAPGKFFKWIKGVAGKVKDTVKKGYTAVKKFITDGGAQKIIDTAGKVIKGASTVVDALPSNRFTEGAKGILDKAEGYRGKAQGGLSSAQRVVQKLPNIE